MKSRSGFVVGLVLLAVAPSADAHFKLTSPPEWIVTNATGDPQKGSPCGPPPAGTPSNVITRVKPGSKLMLRWNETVFHPGHYRIAISPDRSQFKDPVPLSNNSCQVAIAANPQAPVVVDGLFVHSAPPQSPYQYELTIPNMKCDKCTIQIVEVMTEPAKTPPNCFYHHCADIQITDDVGDGGTSLPADAGARDAGAPMRDSGVGGVGGTPGTPGGGGAGGSAGGSNGGGTAGTTGTAGRGGTAGAPGTGGAGGTDMPENPTSATKKHQTGGGCAIGHAGPRSSSVMLLAALLIVLATRRRRA